MAAVGGSRFVRPLAHPILLLFSGVAGGDKFGHRLAMDLASSTEKRDDAETGSRN